MPCFYQGTRLLLYPSETALIVPPRKQHLKMNPRPSPSRSPQQHPLASPSSSDSRSGPFKTRRANHMTAPSKARGQAGQLARSLVHACALHLRCFERQPSIVRAAELGRKLRRESARRRLGKKDGAERTLLLPPPPPLRVYFRPARSRLSVCRFSLPSRAAPGCADSAFAFT